MNIRHTLASGQAFAAAPAAVQKAFLKQVGFLQNNLNHPSLRAKKYDETQNLRQARVNKNWRFYFTIERNAYLIRDIIPHPKK